MSESREVILKLSPPTGHVLAQYAKAAKDRDYIELQGSPDGYIMVVDQDDNLVAGVSIFASGGRYILFEDAVSKPGWHPKVVYRAGEIITEQILCYCNLRDKIPVCPVTAPGVAKMMVKRFGFEAIPALVLRKQPEAIPMESVTLTPSRPKPEPKPAPENDVEPLPPRRKRRAKRRDLET